MPYKGVEKTHYWKSLELKGFAHKFHQKNTRCGRCKVIVKKGKGSKRSVNHSPATRVGREKPCSYRV